MSGLAITIQTLLAGPGVTALVDQRIYPIAAPQGAAPEHIVVHLVSEPEEELLQGATQWPESRVSVECRSETPHGAVIMGQAVIDWLRDKDRYSIRDYDASFRKEGTDETNASDQTSASTGLPTVSRRIIDFYVRWRVAS